MNVWIIYQKDGYGGQEAGEVFSNEDAATRFVMDRDSYLLKNDDWDEDRLRKHAKSHLHECEVRDAY